MHNLQNFLAAYHSLPSWPYTYCRTLPFQVYHNFLKIKFTEFVSYMFFRPSFFSTVRLIFSHPIFLSHYLPISLISPSVSMLSCRDIERSPLVSVAKSFRHCSLPRGVFGKWKACQEFLILHVKENCLHICKLEWFKSKQIWVYVNDTRFLGKTNLGKKLEAENLVSDSL